MNKLMTTLALAALLVIVAASKADHWKQHLSPPHNKQPDVYHQSQGYKHPPHQPEGNYRTLIHHQAEVHQAPAPVHGHGQQGHSLSQNHGHQYGGFLHGGQKKDHHRVVAV